jgi:hypothetical protein
LHHAMLVSKPPRGNEETAGKGNLNVEIELSRNKLPHWVPPTLGVSSSKVNEVKVRSNHKAVP